jgi:t-SNARE complex subunit (syntaxin)
LSDEKKYEILGFELNNITENQDGVEDATGKLTQIVHSISDKACKTSITCFTIFFKAFTQSKLFLLQYNIARIMLYFIS